MRGQISEKERQISENKRQISEKERQISENKKQIHKIMDQIQKEKQVTSLQSPGEGNGGWNYTPGVIWIQIRCY